jgi:hypothetical protein
MIIERDIGDMENRRIFAECSEEHGRRAASVLDVFEKLAGSGSPLRPGFQIRFGWSLLRLEEEAEEENALRVTEPDFAAWPEERWVPTIDLTLEVLAAQTGLLHRLDVDSEDVFFDQKLVAAPGALAQPEIFLRRGDTLSEEDSGWLLGSVEDPEALTRGEGLESVLVASLVERRRALLQALTLPAGFIAIFSGDSIEQVLDAAGRELF